MTSLWLLGLTLCSVANFATGTLPHVTCERDYKKIGCVHVKIGASRSMLVNDRDKTSSKYQGFLLNWKEFGKSIHSLACRCKQSAVIGGYPYFSISFYAECYGLNSGLNITALAGNPSTDCVGPNFKQCSDSETQECVGKDTSQYVYQVGLGSKQEERVDGGFSAWSDWGYCSVSCGSGQMSRERTCNNPVPLGAGKDCSELGPTTEVKECSPRPCMPLINLSVKKVATQSSLYVHSYPAHATNAVDGNTDTAWESRSCTHTNSEQNPWWQVDLNDMASVQKVIIYNRMDCCSERLNNLKVTVGNDIKGTNSIVCGQVQNMQGVSVTTVECPEPLMGRYVRISIPSGYLTLCEVQVMGHTEALINLSLMKVATQSSLYVHSYPAHATNAVDGNTNTAWESRSCTHTNSEQNPWWQVDMNHQALVQKVIIYNRMDCCSERLNNLKVTISNDDKGTNSIVCGQVQNMQGVSVTTVECQEPLVGRYVRISIPSGYLTLCEVQVMGRIFEGSIHNMALGKVATQSSLYTASYPANAKNAVDGNRQTSWESRSCTHTNLQDNPWWQVDLGQTAAVEKVVIYNRMDCCSQRLNNFVVSVGSDPNGVGHTICGGNENMQSIAKKDVACPKPAKGRYVRIFIPRREYLTLCEVEVMGNYV